MLSCSPKEVIHNCCQKKKKKGTARTISDAEKSTFLEGIIPLIIKTVKCCFSFGALLLFLIFFIAFLLYLYS